MCGICGYTGERVQSVDERMLAGIRHRGPDGEAFAHFEGIHLGHTRLAVIDPDNGAQPMSAADGRYVVTYNGEIYNYAELRRQLEALGHRFQTDCDTEIIPVGFAEWGEDLFGKLDGMFAFALLDRTSGAIWLVRDPLGIKPLYYAFHAGNLVFASTVRAVLAHPAVGRELRQESLRDFVQYRWIRSGHTMYEQVHVLQPGTALRLHAGEMTADRYWRPGNARASIHSEGQLVDALHGYMDEAVRRHLRSDVPVSVFLSGGVDSSYIARLAARHGARGMQAVTIDVGLSEDVEGAAELAGTLGFEHRVVRLLPDDFDALPAIIGGMDRPVGDAIVLATWKLCAETAAGAKVALSGEGADEMFAGYVHLPVVRRLAGLGGVAGLVRALAPVLGLVPTSVLDRLFKYEAALGTMGRQAAVELLRAVGDSGALLARAQQVLADSDLERATHFAPASHEPADLSMEGLRNDLLAGWLPEQILQKTDELSMAHGLEVRVPYVTTGLVDLLAGVDEPVLLRGGRNKALLREAAAKEGLSAAARRKRAFHVSLESQWRAPLGKIVDEWLSAEALRKYGIFRPDYVSEIRAKFQAGEFLASKVLFNMAATHMWLEAEGRA